MERDYVLFTDTDTDITPSVAEDLFNVGTYTPEISSGSLLPAESAEE